MIQAKGTELHISTWEIENTNHVEKKSWENQ